MKNNNYYRNRVAIIAIENYFQQFVFINNNNKLLL